MFSSSSLSTILQSNTLNICSMGLDTQQPSLRGVVAFNSSASSTIKRIYLKFSGELSLVFPADIKRTRRNIINLAQTIFEPHKAAPISGQHVFPFEVLIPNDLPESFQGDFGTIKYTLKAVAETAFTSYNLKSKVPVYIHHSISTTEELSEAYELEHTIPNKVACKVTLPTDVYTPDEKFAVEVSALPLNQTVCITQVTCNLKEYTYFHIPSKSDESRLSVAEFVKFLSTSSATFKTDENFKTLIMRIPSYADLDRINKLVEVTHKIVVRIDWINENGEKDYTIWYIPITIGTSELNQLPAYCAVELPPSYHVACQSLDAQVALSSLPPSYY
ncbi:hypothetical protein K7432_009147 [Basidiobolus ranarum]|uniref:Arrestin-like N-terminal domain-containing protein n=1 Tax=Basidiobolus ranarum TaxID=34480 RepID=A0ABR2VXK6_9FUNG